MNKHLLFGTTVVGLSLAIAGTGLASAHGRMNKSYPAGGPSAEVENAIENSDYNAWVEALQGHAQLPFDLNETTFQAFVEAHGLLENGDPEGAQAVLENAGVDLPPRGPRGMEHDQAMGKGFAQHGPNEAIREAITSNDYNAWLEAIADKPMAEIANEELFNKMVQINQARQAGDRDAAKALHNELHDLIKSLRSN